jgi:hypothetical protein
MTRLLVHKAMAISRDHFNDLEERSRFRRPTIATASSLSVSGKKLSTSDDSSAGGRSDS